MDEKNQEINLEQKTSFVSTSESWIDDLPPEIPPVVNEFIETTDNMDIEPADQIDDQQAIDHTVVGPFISSSTHTSIAPFDINVYQQKKTLAQGMMDLALISANANQMRYIIHTQDEHFYTAAMCMIISSLVLQVVVGIGLIWNSRYNVKEQAQTRHANQTNNWTVIGIFLVTILNVFISSFGVSGPTENTSKDVTSPPTGDYDLLYKHNLTIDD